jgi:cellulose biosynthesis protein BcsQ
MTHETTQYKLENYRLFVSHGDKGGVGKSILSRLIAEYLKSKGLIWRGIDADLRNPDFARYYNEVTIQPISNEDDLVALLNTLETSTDADRYVINLPAQAGLILDSETVSALSEINMTSCCFFMMNSERDSTQQLKNFIDKNGSSFSKIVAVQNGYFGREDQFSLFQQSKTRKALLEEFGGSELFLPKFEATTVLKKLSTLQSSDGRSFSFSSAIEEKVLTIAERSSLRSWMQKCFSAFESI